MTWRSAWAYLPIVAVAVYLAAVFVTLRPDVFGWEGVERAYLLFSIFATWAIIVMLKWASE